MGGNECFGSTEGFNKDKLEVVSLKQNISCLVPDDILPYLSQIREHINHPDNQYSKEKVKNLMPDTYLFKGHTFNINKTIIDNGMLIYFNHPSEEKNPNFYYLSTVLYGASIDEAEILNEETHLLIPVKGALNTNIMDYIYFLNNVKKGFVEIEGLVYKFKKQGTKWKLLSPDNKSIAFYGKNIDFNPNIILSVGHALRENHLLTYTDDGGFNKPGHISRHNMFIQSYPNTSDKTIGHEGLHIHFDNNLKFRIEIAEKLIERLTKNEKEAILYSFAKQGFYDVRDKGATHTLVIDELLAGSHISSLEKNINLDLEISDKVAYYKGNEGFWENPKNLGDFNSLDSLIEYFFNSDKIIQNENIPEIRKKP